MRKQLTSRYKYKYFYFFCNSISKALSVTDRYLIEECNFKVFFDTLNKNFYVEFQEHSFKVNLTLKTFDSIDMTLIVAYKDSEMNKFSRKRYSFSDYLEEITYTYDDMKEHIHINECKNDDCSCIFFDEEHMCISCHQKHHQIVMIFFSYAQGCSSSCVCCSQLEGI